MSVQRNLCKLQFISLLFCSQRNSILILRQQYLLLTGADGYPLLATNESTEDNSGKFLRQIILTIISKLANKAIFH